MRTRFPLRTALIFIIALVAVGIVGRIVLRKPSPLTLTSSATNVHVASIVCTFGTNHVYYYGNPLSKLMDPLETRLSTTNANRVRCTTDQDGTVVWVRFAGSEYGIIPPRTPAGAPMVGPDRFRASLTETNGKAIFLTRKNTMQHFRQKFYVQSWELPGSLTDHPGGIFQVDFVDGKTAATFQIP
jgi:hypothetical protein